MKSPTVSLVKSKKYIMGYVVGIIYSDGFEWLTRGNNLVSLRDGTKESNATLYSTPEAAAKKAVALAKTVNHPVFYRIYTYSTPNPENAKKYTPLTNQSLKPVFI